jgi:putative oxidoreductase
VDGDCSDARSKVNRFWGWLASDEFGVIVPASALMKTRDVFFWARNHFEYFLDAVRIYLGVGLIFKGISFLTNGIAANESLGGTWLAEFAPIVPYAHVIGGAMLAAGVFSRIAALSQIPILLAAVFMVNAPRMDTIRGREAVEFSALVLFLLVLIAIKGAGPLALDRRLRRIEQGPRARFAWQRWADDHSDVFADLVRIYLGIGLFIKGLYIVGHQSEMFSMLNAGGNIPFGLTAAAHYVIPVHFVGGVLLALGMAVRPAAIAQIPPLIAAIFYFMLPRFTALVEMRESLEFTALVTFLLALIAVFGAGRLAIENAGRKPVVVGPSIQPAH